MAVGETVIVALVGRQAVAVHFRQEAEKIRRVKSQTRKSTASRRVPCAGPLFEERVCLPRYSPAGRSWGT